MTHHAKFPLSLNPTQRTACALAAVACAAGVNLALLGLFHSASSDPWVNPTPQLLSAKASCDTLPDRAARTHCVQALVARALATANQPQQLAAR